MDNKQITAGLAHLVDELPPNVDIDAVIATAKLRSQRRQAVTFTALGTATVVVALTAVLTSAGAGQNEPAAGGNGLAATKPPAVTTSGTPSPGSRDQAGKLTKQLADANALPADAVVDPSATDPFTGKPVAALEFVPPPGGPDGDYMAFAKLTRGQVPSDLTVSVSSGAARKDGGNAGECPPGGVPCTPMAFPDGTRAHVMVTDDATRVGVVSMLTAQRPDGTYIQVICSTSGNQGATKGSPEPPLGVEDMFKFATIFTW